MIIATTTIILANLLLSPQAQDPWGILAAGASEPGAMVVSGMPELTASEAYESARAQAGDELRSYLVAKGEVVVEQSSPVWLPGFIEKKILDRWVQGVNLKRIFAVVDQEQVERDHGHSMSYQTHLLIKRDEQRVDRSLQSLARRTAQEGELFLAKCGGTVILWAALALICGWLDRLTRGYMSGRLRFLFSGLGLSLPAIAFLII